jgi:PAS domain S-box-containing protein
VLPVGELRHGAKRPMGAVKRRFLYRKLAGSVVRMACLLALVAAAASFAVEFERARGDAGQRLEQLLDTVEETAAIAAFIDDREMAEAVLARLLRHEVVQQAELRNNRGLALSRRQPSRPLPGAASIRLLRSPDRTGDIVGRISLAASLEFVLNQALHGLELSVLNSTLFVLLTTLSLLSIVRSQLSRPLDQVSATLHGIGAGERERLPPLSGHEADELGVLVKDINGLLDSLQQQFESKHALLSFALDHVHEAAYLTDALGRFHYVNRQACRALGYSREELLALSVGDIDPQRSPDQWHKRWELIRSQGCHTVESSHKTKDGRVFPVEITVNYFEYEGRPYNLALVRDIAERKRMEAALRESERHFRGLVEAWPDEIARYDRECRRVYVNPYTETTLVPANGLLGLTPTESHPHSKELRFYEDRLREVLATGAVLDFEMGWGAPAAQPRYRLLRLSPERDSDGSITGVFALARDITELKRSAEIDAARLRLLQFAAAHSLDDVLQATLDEAEALTGSCIGFYHFLAEDQQTVSLQQWSTRTKAEFCRADAKGQHYSVAETGVWVDCIQQGRPVIHNDYATLAHRKGMPEGHAKVVRELVVPVFRNDLIVAIVGVGNKAADYTAEDVAAVSRLADLSWEIADRKRTELVLAASESRFRSVFENSPVSIWEEDLSEVKQLFDALRVQGVSDLSGHLREHPEAVRHCLGRIRVIDANRASLELLEAGAKEELIREPARSFTQESCDGFQRQLLAIWNGETEMVTDAAIRTLGGNLRQVTVYFSVTPGHEQSYSNVLVSLVDITERKRVEAVLVQYAAIVESTDDAVVGEDLNGMITAWNGAAARMFGYGAEEVLGRPIDLLLPQQHRYDEVAILDEIRQGRAVRHFETARRRKDGTLIDVSVTVSPLRNRQGEVIGASKIARDITESKKAEGELRRYREHLEEVVAERTAALEAANRELEAFSYSVSHDLRTPLRAVDGFARMLSNKYGAQLDAEAQRLIQVVRDNAGKMAQLIDDMLAFSRCGRSELKTVAVDMEQLVRTVWAELEPLRAGRELCFEVGSLPPVRGDAAMLRQVWNNLLANALKFTRQVPAGRIRVDGAVAQGQCQYRVADNGVGFDQAYVHKLFGVFQRLHAVDEFEGTGIGLAIVKRVIERHGGSVDARGDPGAGATFSFSIPLEGDEPCPPCMKR